MTFRSRSERSIVFVFFKIIICHERALFLKSVKVFFKFCGFYKNDESDFPVFFIPGTLSCRLFLNVFPCLYKRQSSIAFIFLRKPVESRSRKSVIYMREVYILHTLPIYYEYICLCSGSSFFWRDSLFVFQL